MRFFAVAGISMVVGCTHRQSLGDGRALAGASVRFEAQPEFEERGDVVEAQGRVLIRSERGDFELDEVVTITEIKRLRGAAEGSGWGVLVGASVGAALGYAKGDSKEWPYSAADNAVVSGIMMGAFGTIIGIVLGAVSGSRDVYTISGTPPSQTRFIPAGPAGSALGATIRF